MRHRGYIAAVISNSCAQRLRRAARYERTFCHHITMAYRPSKKIFAKYAAFIGKRVLFEVLELVTDENGQAVRVSGVPCENKHPHITVSCAPGIEPVYSNRLLARRNASTHRLTFSGVATIQFIPL